jgi:ATP-binding cassette subfamily B protein
MCARNFTETINSLVNTSTFVFLALASAQRIFEILHEKEECDLPTAKSLSNKFKGDIEVKNLSFFYNDGKFVLKNLNFKIKAGQTIAIVGPTGAGKTTFINLMTKFYDNIQGDILLDGISIKKITRHSLRKNIAIVTQDTFLFAESI